MRFIFWLSKCIVYWNALHLTFSSLNTFHKFLWCIHYFLINFTYWSTYNMHLCTNSCKLVMTLHKIFYGLFTFIPDRMWPKYTKITYYISPCTKVIPKNMSNHSMFDPYLHKHLLITFDLKLNPFILYMKM